MTKKDFVVVIHQPACSNVLLVQPEHKNVFRLKQMTRDYCLAYGHGYADSKNIMCFEDVYGVGNASAMYTEALGWLAVTPS